MTSEQSGEITSLLVVGATWCGPCKMLKSQLSQLLTDAELDPQVRHLDVDENEEECEKLRITRLPTTLFLVGDVEKDRHIGLASFDRFLQRCKAHLAFENHFE